MAIYRDLLLGKYSSVPDEGRGRSCASIEKENFSVYLGFKALLLIVPSGRVIKLNLKPTLQCVNVWNFVQLKKNKTKTTKTKKIQTKLFSATYLHS